MHPGVVGVSTCYGLVLPRYESQLEQCLSLLHNLQGPDVWSTIFLYYRYRGIKLPALEFDYSLALNTEVKNEWSCTSAPLCSLMVWTGKNLPCYIARRFFAAVTLPNLVSGVIRYKKSLSLRS